MTKSYRVRIVVEGVPRDKGAGSQTITRIGGFETQGDALVAAHTAAGALRRHVIEENVTADDDGRDWAFELDEATSGRGDWFTSHLLRLIAKADLVHRTKLRVAFPEAVDAFERWQASSGEFERSEQ